MYKNVASQKIALFEFDTTSGLPKTGDASNITGYVTKDWGSVTVLGTSTPTEMDSTNAPGWYVFTLTQGETNADVCLFTAKSSTSKMSIVGQEVFPLPGSNSGVSANVAQINADSTSAANLAKTTRTIGRGTVGSSATNTSVTTSSFTPSVGATDQFKGRTMIFDGDTTTTSLRGQAAVISGGNTNSATPTFTVDALTTNPASGDTFSVI
jgi:hypothetical protein